MSVFGCSFSTQNRNKSSFIFLDLSDSCGNKNVLCVICVACTHSVSLNRWQEGKFLCHTLPLHCIFFLEWHLKSEKNKNKKPKTLCSLASLLFSFKIPHLPVCGHFAMLEICFLNCLYSFVPINKLLGVMKGVSDISFLILVIVIQVLFQLLIFKYHRLIESCRVTPRSSCALHLLPSSLTSFY